MFAHSTTEETSIVVIIDMIGGKFFLWQILLVDYLFTLRVFIE